MSLGMAHIWVGDSIEVNLGDPHLGGERYGSLLK